MASLVIVVISLILAFNSVAKTFIAILWYLIEFAYSWLLTIIFYPYWLRFWSMSERTPPIADPSLEDWRLHISKKYREKIVRDEKSMRKKEFRRRSFEWERKQRKLEKKLNEQVTGPPEKAV
jgi:hypothetical protein